MAIKKRLKYKILNILRLSSAGAVKRGFLSTARLNAMLQPNYIIAKWKETSPKRKILRINSKRTMTLGNSQRTATSVNRAMRAALWSVLTIRNQAITGSGQICLTTISGSIRVRRRGRRKKRSPKSTKKRRKWKRLRQTRTILMKTILRLLITKMTIDSLGSRKRRSQEIVMGSMKTSSMKMLRRMIM